MLFQALPHWATSTYDARLMFPFFVNVSNPSNIHFSQHVCSWDLKLLFTLKSYGCSIFINPPEIRLRSAPIVFCFADVITDSFVCAFIETNIYTLKNAPSRYFQTSFNQSCIIFSLTHSFSLQLMMMLLGKSPLGRIFFLKMIKGFNFVPSAQLASITIKCVFSLSVVVIDMLFVLYVSTVQLGG